MSTFNKSGGERRLAHKTSLTGAFDNFEREAVKVSRDLRKPKSVGELRNHSKSSSQHEMVSVVTVPRKVPQGVGEYLEAAMQARDKKAGRPVNFGIVMDGVFRSGYPAVGEYDHLRHVGVKTVLTLVRLEEMPEGYQVFLKKHRIEHITLDMNGTKKEAIPLETMERIMNVVCNPSNHPLLIHCNKGKHRTGCSVAVMRKLMGWHVDDIIAEYKNYAADKPRDPDLAYIRAFDISALSHIAAYYELTPVRPKIKLDYRAKQRDTVKWITCTLMAAFFMAVFWNLVVNFPVAH